MKRQPIIRHREVDLNILPWCFNCWTVGLHDENRCPEDPLTYPERDKLRRDKDVPMLQKWKRQLLRRGYKELAEGIEPVDGKEGHNSEVQDRGNGSVAGGPQDFGLDMKQKKDEGSLKGNNIKESSLATTPIYVESDEDWDPDDEGCVQMSRDITVDETKDGAEPEVNAVVPPSNNSSDPKKEYYTTSRQRSFMSTDRNIREQPNYHGREGNFLSGERGATPPQQATQKPSPFRTPLQQPPTNTSPGHRVIPTWTTHKIPYVHKPPSHMLPHDRNAPPFRASTPSSPARRSPTPGWGFVAPVQVENLRQSPPAQVISTIITTSELCNRYAGSFTFPPGQMPVRAFPDDAPKVVNEASSPRSLQPLGLVPGPSHPGSLNESQVSTPVDELAEPVDELWKEVADTLATMDLRSHPDTSMMASQGSLESGDGGRSGSTYTRPPTPETTELTHNVIPTDLPKAPRRDTSNALQSHKLLPKNRSLRLINIDLLTRVFTIEQRQERLRDQMQWVIEDVDAVRFRVKRIDSQIDRLRAEIRNTTFGRH